MNAPTPPNDLAAQNLLRRMNRDESRADTRAAAQAIKHKLEHIVAHLTVDEIIRTSLVANHDASPSEAVRSLAAEVSAFAMGQGAIAEVFARALAAERARLEPYFAACDERMLQIAEEVKLAHGRVVVKENEQSAPVARWKSYMVRGLLVNEIEKLLGIKAPQPRPESELVAERLGWHRERDDILAGLKAEQLAINDFKRTLNELALPVTVIEMVET